MNERHIHWTDERCAVCNRPPYMRRDGREYLYRYGESKPVCSQRCAAKAAEQQDA